MSGSDKPRRYKLLIVSVAVIAVLSWIVWEGRAAVVVNNNGPVVLDVTLVNSVLHWQLKYPDRCGVRVNAFRVEVRIGRDATVTGFSPTQGTGLHSWSWCSWGGIMSGETMRYRTAEKSYMPYGTYGTKVVWQTELTATGIYRAMLYEAAGLGKGYAWTDTGTVSLSGADSVCAYVIATVWYGNGDGKTVRAWISER